MYRKLAILFLCFNLFANTASNELFLEMEKATKKNDLKKIKKIIQSHPDLTLSKKQKRSLLKTANYTNLNAHKFTLDLIYLYWGVHYLCGWIDAKNLPNQPAILQTYAEKIYTISKKIYPPMNLLKALVGILRIYNHVKNKSIKTLLNKLSESEVRLNITPDEIS